MTKNNGYALDLAHRNPSKFGLDEVLSDDGQVNAGAQDLMTIDELRRYIRAPKKTVYGWTHRQEIPHVKFGRSLRFSKRAIDAWIKSKEVPVHRVHEKFS